MNERQLLVVVALATLEIPPCVHWLAAAERTDWTVIVNASDRPIELDTLWRPLFPADGGGRALAPGACARIALPASRTAARVVWDGHRDVIIRSPDDATFALAGAGAHEIPALADPEAACREMWVATCTKGWDELR